MTDTLKPLATEPHESRISVLLPRHFQLQRRSAIALALVCLFLAAWSTIRSVNVGQGSIHAVDQAFAKSAASGLQLAGFNADALGTRIWAGGDRPDDRITAISILEMSRHLLATWILAIGFAVAVCRCAAYGWVRCVILFALMLGVPFAAAFAWGASAVFDRDLTHFSFANLPLLVATFSAIAWTVVGHLIIAEPDSAHPHPEHPLSLCRPTMFWIATIGSAALLIICVVAMASSRDSISVLGVGHQGVAPWTFAAAIIGVSIAAAILLLAWVWKARLIGYVWLPLLLGIPYGIGGTESACVVLLCSAASHDEWIGWYRSDSIDSAAVDRILNRAHASLMLLGAAAVVSLGLLIAVH